MKNKSVPIEYKYEPPVELSNPYGNNLLDDLNTLLTESIKSIKTPDLDNITKAFYFCVDSHKNVYRVSGEPYYTHPLKVAISLMRDFSIGDNAATIAALLHDTVEDNPDITKEIVQDNFGEDVANLVDGVTKIRGEMTRQMDTGATYGKLFLALIEDIRTILIKLADRLDNMRTLSFLKEDKRIAIATETLNFYTPFAQRMGLTKIRRDLEDLSLYFIDPEKFENIRSALEKKGKLFLDYIKNFFILVAQKLNDNSIDHVITIEHKHVYEIYKMIEDGRQLNEIDDFYSIVITLNTDDFSECYRTYGIIANVFGPVSSLDDFIARPKINLYRALHSTHFGPGRKLVEVIIRTQQMDKIAVEGIAAMYPVKENLKSFYLNREDVKNWVNWMQMIIEESDEDAIQKIWGTIKMNLYNEQITVHLKNGNSYQLPQGACPIDLAFAISDDFGFHSISAKINGEIKSLDYELKDNDHVELITSPNTTPSFEWQQFVVTQRAVVKLYDYFKKNPLQDQITMNLPAHFEIKIRITAEDRPGLLRDITQEIGQINIQRISISTSNNVFEGIFALSMLSKIEMNNLFTKLLNIKNLKGIEKIEE